MNRIFLLELLRDSMLPGVISGGMRLKSFGLTDRQQKEVANERYAKA
jgi:hypothetical protein